MEMMDNVYCDILELRESYSGFKFLIADIDYFSKFVWLKALEQKSAIKMADFLDKIMSLFGAIGVLSVDNAFDNSILRDMLYSLGTIPRFSLPYNHEAMGPVERTNRTVRVIVEDSPREIW